MGFRTLVMLYNDESRVWAPDQDLGKKILYATNGQDTRIPGGRVVECCHADQQTLAIVDSYSFDRMATGNWRQGQTQEIRNLDMLSRFAENLGYDLVKKGSNE